MAVAVSIEQVHRLSVGEYERLVADGFFADARVELIDGLVLDMSPKSPAHENVVQWLMVWLMDRLDRQRFQLRISAPLRLADGEPEPDIAVCRADYPRSEHPRRAELVIEVAASSRERDLTIKPGVYAPATSDYWVVDLPGRRLVCHREPSATGFGEVSALPAHDSLTPLTLELPPVPLKDLFAAAS